MALKLEAHQHRYIGLSTDPKTTEGIPVGSTIFETDTKRLFVFDGRDWLNKGVESLTDSLLADLIQAQRETNDLLTLLVEAL